jgi:hypothetical protein
MLRHKIFEEIDNKQWNRMLLNSKYSTCYQSTNFLIADENRFPIFIYIKNQKNRILNRLILTN